MTTRRAAAANIFDFRVLTNSTAHLYSVKRKIIYYIINLIFENVYINYVVIVNCQAASAFKPPNKRK